MARFEEQGIRDQGFAIVSNVFAEDEIGALTGKLGNSRLHRTRAGIRHALRDPLIAEFARDARLINLTGGILGGEAVPFRATLFDKSPDSNWLVAWHQDTALPVHAKQEAAGWGPWSVKDGVIYAHAPASALTQVVALRIHLDD
jgi:hypothetical protein